jgi:hypothetical protein
MIAMGSAHFAIRPSGRWPIAGDFPGCRGLRWRFFKKYLALNFFSP